MIEKDIFINETATIKCALKKLTKSAVRVLLVVDDSVRLIGALTDGDIRRCILKGRSLESSIKDVYNKHPLCIKKKDFRIKKAKEIFLTNRLDLLPIVDKDNRVVDFLTWSEAFSESEKQHMKSSRISLPVVIMAGGKGTRLEPFSKILPKPLIPIGDKPIIEIIIEKFKKLGVNDFYIIVNYKGEMIKSYFDHMKKDYKVEYIWEKGFLGTAGGLKLLEKKIGDTFIVSNCDVIVNADIEEVVDFHKSKKSLLTVLSSIQHHEIPYGVVKFKDEGRVIDIVEKPEYTFTVNAGVYVLSKEALNYVPDKKFYDMTDLINSLIKNKKRVFTYPVNEGDYIDIGHWDEYKKAIEKLNALI